MFSFLSKIARAFQNLFKATIIRNAYSLQFLDISKLAENH